MKKLLFAGIALVVLDVAASAAELPTFELAGFPISQHQVALLGGINVQEQSPTPTLVFDGMPASPHQIVVLTPRSRVIEAKIEKPKLTTVGLTAR
ncbi:hypothetical protein Q2941_34665 [Bradyrhizobium sp. UFLA05-153]